MIDKPALEGRGILERALAEMTEENREMIMITVGIRVCGRET